VLTVKVRNAGRGLIFDASKARCPLDVSLLQNRRRNRIGCRGTSMISLRENVLAIKSHKTTLKLKNIRIISVIFIPIGQRAYRRNSRILFILFYEIT
jgi:hypothetical protein